MAAMETKFGYMSNTFDLRAPDIENALDSLRPAMEADGGGVDLVSVVDGVVGVRLKGTCLMCPSASLTLRIGIERTLRTRFPAIKEVIRVL